MTDKSVANSVIVEVTDHAVLRYLERAQGINVEGLRAQIRQIVLKGAEHGASAVHYEGMRFVLRNNSVTTVLNRVRPEAPKPSRRNKERD
ncbi:MAG: hypothetical protein ACK43M_14515 [Allorhizobium sp.]